MTAALVPVAGDRAAGYLAATMARAQDYARRSRASSTLRAYASDLRDFERYCASIGAGALPSTPEVLVMYLTDLADRAKIATIRRRVVAINRAHKERGLPSPTSHDVVRAVLTGIANVKGSAPRRKAALTADLVRAVLLETAAGLRGLRDRAILLLGFAGALRRSELAALTVADLSFTAEGLVVHLRRSKTDQGGVGRDVAVPSIAIASVDAVAAVRTWLDAISATDGPVFRAITRGGRLEPHAIAGIDVARLVQRLTRRAGVAGDFGAHSLRAGFVTSAAMRGVPEIAIQGVTGHRSVTVLRGYVRRATLFEDAPLRSIF